MTPDKLPVPLPPEPRAAAGWKALLEHRTLLVALAVVLFFGAIFGLGWFFKGKTTVPAAVHREAPVAVRPLVPAAPVPAEHAKVEISEPKLTPPKAAVEPAPQPEKPRYTVEAPPPLARSSRLPTLLPRWKESEARPLPMPWPKSWMTR